MASDWQKRANARNASNSTGPRTEQGKKISSRNSIKHGYTAIKLDDQTGDPEFEERRAAWVEVFSPRNEIARALAEQSFIDMRRLRRLSEAEERAAQESYLTAGERFELERVAEADDAMAKLIEQPHMSWIVLSGTVHGCERLQTLLNRLERRLDENAWSAVCLRQLRAVAGQGAESDDLDLEAASAFVVEHQGRPESELGREDAELLAEARSWIRERIHEDRDFYCERVEQLEGEEERARLFYMMKAKLDLSPSGQLLQRSLVQADNAFHRSLLAAQKATGADLRRAGRMIRDTSKDAPAPLKPASTESTPANVSTPSKPVEPIAAGSVPGPAAGGAPLRNEPKSNSNGRIGYGNGYAKVDVAVGVASPPSPSGNARR